MSDTYGQYISVDQMASGQFHLTSNQTGHYDLMIPNSSVTLIVKAVDADGNPITNPLKTVLYLRSSNYSSKMTMDGTSVKSLVLEQGSLGVPFRYTKLLSAPSSTNISLQQAQAGQSASTATATESQSTTFASGSSMRLDFNQQQNQSATSFLQTESINASVADPGSTASTPGTLYIYKDGVLQATYGGVTGNLTASEQQNLSTANTTDTTQSASVDFISGGSRVQLSI